jgi:hypothetical protein
VNRHGDWGETRRYGWAGCGDSPGRTGWVGRRAGLRRDRGGGEPIPAPVGQDSSFQRTLRQIEINLSKMFRCDPVEDPVESVELLADPVELLATLREAEQFVLNATRTALGLAENALAKGGGVGNKINPGGVAVRDFVRNAFQFCK